MDIRKTVNDLIAYITDGTPISQVLLKAQIVAFNVGDEYFKRLIKSEQEGYTSEDELPSCRKQKCMVEATVVIPFQDTQTIEVHTEVIEDERIKELMSHAFIREPLVQLEAMYNNAGKDMLRIQLPTFAYPVIKDLYKGFNGQIHSAYQCFPKESILSIVDTFKSKLLDLLLRFDKELDWNIELSDSRNRTKAQTIIYNAYNINAAVANTGGGTIETKNIDIDTRK